jgi:hypothetical protein
MTAVRLVAVFAENRLGQMARVTRVIAEAGVNIRWVTIATSETFGVIKFLLDDPDRAFERLKQAGFTASIMEVLAVAVEDRPGGLHGVAELLSASGVNVQNASGIVTDGGAVLIFEVKDIAAARAVLPGRGLRLLSHEEALGGGGGPG